MTTATREAELHEATTAQVAAWREVYDGYYREDPPDLGADHFDGWISSYDLRPLPVEHMLEWRDAVVAKILAHRPRRVLEIGCGTGMLAEGLVLGGADYVGVDVSPAGIASFRQALAARPDLADRIELACLAAHEVSRLPVAGFDTIVLNSVVQYFPDAAYLVAVLRDALSVAAPGARIVLSDVRNLRTHGLFLTASRLSRQLDARISQDTLDRVDAAEARGRELMLAPEFFALLPRDLPAITAVDIQLKRGVWHNEASRHRYEVVLHTDVRAVDATAGAMWHWRDFGDVAVLAEFLRRDRPATLRVMRVPNERLAGEFAAVRHLAAQGDPAEAGALLALRATPTGEAFHALGAELGYRVAVVPGASSDEYVNVVLVADDVAPPAAALNTFGPVAFADDLHLYANVPNPVPLDR